MCSGSQDAQDTWLGRGRLSDSDGQAVLKSGDGLWVPAAQPFLGLHLVIPQSLYGSRASPFSFLGLSFLIHKMGITKYSSGVGQATHMGSGCGVALNPYIHLLREGGFGPQADGCKALCVPDWMAGMPLPSFSQELQDAPVWVKGILTGDLSCSCGQRGTLCTEKEQSETDTSCGMEWWW